ncbi:helitron_like_N domain-containing protein, partial [Trichonephila clavipes]
MYVLYSEQCQENAKADLSRSTNRKLETCEIADPKEQKNKSSNKILMHVSEWQLHQEEEPEDTRAERNEVRRLEQQQSRRFTVNRRRTNDQQRQQGAETNKNVSSKDYYAYRLMIRRGLDNVILRCRELCQQFMVDMYAKIESERLRYLRDIINKLRAEEYSFARLYQQQRRRRRN